MCFHTGFAALHLAEVLFELRRVLDKYLLFHVARYARNALRVIAELSGCESFTAIIYLLSFQASGGAATA